MTQALFHQDASSLPFKRKWYSSYRRIRRALISWRKKKPEWGRLLIAVIVIDSLLAVGGWFAVGYIVK